MPRRTIAVLTLLLCAGVGPAMAQDDPLRDQPRPEAQSLIKSMGFPPRWKPFVGFTIDLDQRSADTAVSGQPAASIYRDLLNPMTGLFGITLEGYVRPAREHVIGIGIQISLGQPYLGRTRPRETR